MSIYVGRFAPSPTGPMHAGSLVAALASWLDARAHGGRWLVRIEDVDHPRCVDGAAELILQQLATCGLVPDEAPVWQSRRDGLYEQALARLGAAGWTYPCGCSRKDIADALSQSGRLRERHGELVYPGTCRTGLHGKTARAMRVLALPATDGASTVADRVHATASAPLVVEWQDRRLGTQQQDVTAEVGDFVLRRADGLWGYQLAVVVDDAAQGVTDIVRGEDLADNTPRQIHLQRALGLPTPRYLHTPLVFANDGNKLSKQNGAQPLDVSDPLAALRTAGSTLGIATEAATHTDWLASAVLQWRARWGNRSGRMEG